MREFIKSAVVLTIIMSLGGCGGSPYGPTGRVAGKLTMEGKTLPAGHSVSFMQMEKGFLAYGITDAEGKFEVKSWNDGQMPIGSYDVMIGPPGGETAEISQQSAEDRFDNPQGNAAKNRVAFPARYRETTKSGLRFEVKEGDNNFDIDLKSK